MVYCDGKILRHCESLVGKNIRLNKVAACFMVGRVGKGVRVYSRIYVLFSGQLGVTTAA